MYTNVNIFQLYDVSKGKTFSHKTVDFSLTNQITLNFSHEYVYFNQIDKFFNREA